MCGIVGYTGSKPVAPILLECLSKLEYRGYDSAGIAVLEEKEIEVRKKVGRLSELQKVIEEKPVCGFMGIGHTRWATHGKPSDLNSHPHTDGKRDFAVVHNGIIENYIAIKEWLQGQGYVFQSETDTEVVPHLLRHYYKGDLKKAVQEVITKLRGSYALAVVYEGEPDKIVVARQDSPLVIGLGEEEYFIASDIPAFLNYTKKALIMEDGEIGVITKDGVTIYNSENQKIEKEIMEVRWDAKAAEKGGYEHFMLKEIHEQPKALRDTMICRLAEGASSVELKEITMAVESIKKLNKVFIVACGTAYHAGVVGKYLIEDLVRLPVEVDVASEFRYRNPIMGENDLMIVVSQSGETADTLAALREAKRRGTRVIAITNVVGSSVSREADDVLYTWAGPEIAVASTKAYLTQILSMYMIALRLAEVRNTLPADKIAAIIDALRTLPSQVEEVLDKEEEIREIAKRFANHEDLFFLGRGLDYAVAMEGSLKLKEISYIHSEAYAAGELKHGTLALIEKDIPVIALATQKDVFEKTLSNIKEVKAREAQVLAVVSEDDAEEMAKSVDAVFTIPNCLDILKPVLSILPLQLLSYYVAKERGCDIDKPRNLAKSVTVE